MRKLLPWARRRPVFASILLVCILGGGFLMFRPKSEMIPETAPVTRGTLQQTVSLTGVTAPVEDLALGFETGGQVNRVLARVGDAVGVGQVLVELSNTELAAQVAEHRARIGAAEARLAQLVRGSRPEDIATKEATLRKVEQDLRNDYASAWDIVQDAEILAEDAVRKQLDELFTNDDESNATLSFPISDSQSKTAAESGRFAAGADLNRWKSELLLAQAPFFSGTGSGDLSVAAKKLLAGAQAHLLLTQNFLGVTLTALLNSNSLSATTLAAYKGYVTTARTNANTALQNVNGLLQDIAAEEAIVEETKSSLAAMRAGSDPQEVSAQRAEVAQTAAALDVAEAKLARTVLRSPITGVVTKQDAKIGQTVGANQILTSVISRDRLEIKANVAEIDIAKIHVGDRADVTLDAYGEDVHFGASVAAIDPAETIIEGVATYKTTLQLNVLDERVRPGMTANIEILGSRHENVLIIPSRAVISRESGKFVQIYAEKKIAERKVEVGLRGSAGDVEILSGLTEGELVVTSVQ